MYFVLIGHPRKNPWTRALVRVQNDSEYESWQRGGRMEGNSSWHRRTSNGVIFRWNLLEKNKNNSLVDKDFAEWQKDPWTFFMTQQAFPYYIIIIIFIVIVVQSRRSPLISNFSSLVLPVNRVSFQFCIVVQYIFVIFGQPFKSTSLGTRVERYPIFFYKYNFFFCICICVCYLSF